MHRDERKSTQRISRNFRLVSFIVPFVALSRLLTRRKNRKTPRLRKEPGREIREPTHDSRGHRLRRRKGKQSGDNKPFSVFISNEDREGALPYKVVRLGDRTGYPGLSLKLSKRGVECYDSDCCRDFDIPYIDKVGKISVFTLVKAHIHPSNFIFTIASTVFKRLQGVLLRRLHKPRDVFDNHKLIFEVALHYSLTWNNWIMDRFLGLTRKGVPRKQVRVLLKRSFKNLSDSQRFVYSQALHLAHWLTSRSERPRDKLKRSMDDAKPFLGYRNDCACQLGYDCPYGSLVYQWTGPDNFD